jgi:hypothetical protein
MGTFLLRAFDFAKIDFEKIWEGLQRKTFLLSTKIFLGTASVALKITERN